MKHFDIGYFMGFLGLLLVEICIAIFVHDSVVRPFLGDVFAIMLLYSFFRTFLRYEAWKIAMGCVIIGVILECAQGMHVAQTLGLSEHRWIMIIFGSTFDPMDLVAYVVGGIACVAIDKLKT